MSGPGVSPPGSRRSQMSFRASDHRDVRRRAPCASDRNRFGFFQRPKKSLNLGVHPPPRVSEGPGMHEGVSELRANVATPLEGRLEAIAAAAWVLEPPAPHERRHVLRSEAGILLDRLLTRCARGRGALDVAIGEGLAALGTGDRVLRLGYSGIGDYARERLGIAASTAQKMARLARELRDRPVLRDAVWVGELTPRQAEAVLPVARGEAEASWVARARTETVRALAAA